MSISYIRDHDRRFIVLSSEPRDRPETYVAGVASRCPHRSIKLVFVPRTNDLDGWLRALKLTRIYQVPGFRVSTSMIDGAAAVLGATLEALNNDTLRHAEIQKLISAYQDAARLMSNLLSALNSSSTALAAATSRIG